MKRSTERIVPLSDLVQKVTSGIEDKYHNRPGVDTYSTGFRSLDDMTCGFHRGDLVAVISDIPDLITAFLLSSVHSLVSRDRIPALFVSARYDESYVVTKLLSIESGIREIELRSGMLQTDQFSALTASATVLYDAPLRIASVNAVSLEDIIPTLTQAETDNDGGSSGPVFIDAPVNRWSDDRVLRPLRETAKNHELPVVLSTRATPEQRNEWQFDRWFDVILQVGPAEVDTELVQVDVLQNRHGTVGTSYLQYDPQRSLVHDIDDRNVSWMDLYTSLKTINGRHGATLRRLGEGAQ